LISVLSLFTAPPVVVCPGNNQKQEIQKTGGLLGTGGRYLYDYTVVGGHVGHDFFPAVPHSVGGIRRAADTGIQQACKR
jgi:hypothetical protein